MATKIYDAVATLGVYNDRQTGEEKKRYQTIGAVFQNDKGQLSLKLETIPVGPEWSGWISFFEPKPQGQQRPASQAAPANRGQQPIADDDDESIPF